MTKRHIVGESAELHIYQAFSSFCHRALKWTMYRYRVYLAS